ncbi:hypothetical protein BJ322DRAFT_1103792 [Thelephora terrestris]|uniref:Zn(2)-C6 fungal-type domain-containing protein n=1 Tax=Thelephora terrestris TaxID=56493 RepID=A0A9P6LCH0_9AGAM|nr:hypothetical protein BJ322DRAFT_1103792 [Thelephora terrestris]
MSDLHFVLENPQDNNRREHKKRPRLVTSCDNCRAKKLKCIKGGENAPCESCTSSGVTCEFRDRDQYFAERSAKSVNAASNSPGSQRPQLSPRARSSVPDYGPSQRGEDLTKRPGSSRSQKSTKSLSSPPLLPSHCPQPTYDSRSAIPDDTPPLFDSNQWQRPNPTLMVSFVNAFYRTGGQQFGFLVYDGLMQQVYTNDLDHVLANSIAAWATRYEKIPELGKLDRTSVSEQYVSRAKLLFSSLPPGPNLSALHALIVLAWLQSSHLDEFYAFAQAANKMSSDMNISAISMSSGDPSHRQVLQQTWSSVSHLMNVSNASTSEGIKPRQ